MPFEIRFENTPMGVCIEAARPGDNVKVLVCGFLSEEDGEALIDCLEGFGSEIIDKLPKSGKAPPFTPGRIDHLLAIVRRDASATVYVNELELTAKARIKRGLKAGEAVYKDDIAGVQSLAFGNVKIPEDAGIVFIFCVGWRRAMYFDFRPLNPKEPKVRDYDLEVQLGQFYNYLMFQKRFKITEKQWQRLFDGQWFPFITLKDSTIKNLTSYAENEWPLDELVELISKELSSLLPNLTARWSTAKAFAVHLKFLEKAVERYQAKDFISTTAILFPRIEGLLRSHQSLADPSEKASQKGLAKSAIKSAVEDEESYTPLLPSKFRQYLESVYFASFNPTEPKIKISRNSVGHGVASAEEFSLKSATISLLLIDQLCFCFTGKTTQHPDSTDGTADKQPG